MPLVSVLRFSAATGPAANTGTQTVTGTLDVSGGVVLEYDPAIFDKAAYGTQTYTVFTYNTLTLGGYASFGAAATSVLTGTGYTSAIYTNDTVAKTITVTLS